MPIEKSAGAVIFRREDNKIYYLLLHYPSSAKAPKEYWDFPKGHIEKGKAVLKNGAPIYPPHAWETGDDGNIWAVFEDTWIRDYERNFVKQNAPPNNIQPKPDARLQGTERGIEIEFTDKEVSITSGWSLTGYEAYFAKLRPKAKMPLDKTALTYVKVLRGSLTTPKLSILSPEPKRDLIVKDSYIQASEEGATIVIFLNKGEAPVRVNQLTDAPLKSPEGFGLEWKHISEKIPNNPEFANKDMYYTRPQILVDGYRVNIWYAGPNVHCGIHDHSKEPVPFKEIHLNLVGKKGGMVKYSGWTKDTEIKRTILFPGEEHWAFWEIDEKGEKPEDTARREIFEETGIEDIKFIPDFKETIKYFFRLKGKTIFKIVTFLLAETKTEKVKISWEHIGFKWLPYEEALEQLTFKNAKEILKKANDFLSEKGL